MRNTSYTVCILILFVSHAFSAPEDPLAKEIARWKNFLETNTSASEDWKSIRESTLPLMQRAETALNSGQRNLAIHVLGAVRMNLAAQKYVQEHHVSGETKLSALEEEWNKARPTLQSPGRPRNLGFLPASVRAVAEASYSEIKVYYEASLEYGKNTMPEYGFYYLGLSQGQLEFIDFLDQMRAAPGSVQQLELPGLAGQIEALEDKLLAAYKPPASVEHHANFIRASALIKQAHELYDAGLTYGALYRLLYASQVLSRITEAGQSIDVDETAKRTKEISGRLRDTNRDHSIGLIFLELANETPYNGETARSVFESILPIYFSSFEPPKSQPEKEVPVATVTLVRWPYT